MATANLRFTLTVTKDIAERAAKLKKDNYYDKPYSEMYRQLILIGMEVLQKQKQQTKD